MLNMSVLFACFKPQTRDRRDSVPRRGQDLVDVSQAADHHPVVGLSYQSEVAYVELLRHSTVPLGLVLKGGVDQNCPVYVAALRPGGVAEQSDALRIGDQVLSINGTATEHLKHSEVEALLQNSGNVVNLEITFESPPVPQLDDVEVKTASISLPKDDNKSFGFIISGGRLENRLLTISHIKQGSVPYKKGILKAGDRILQIGGHDVTNASQTEASQLLKSFNDHCSLVIEYDVTCHKELGNTNGQLLVILQKPHGASLGISLRGSSSPGNPMWISKIRDAGIADRSGALHVGDRLLSIDSYLMDGRTVQEARRLLSQSDINVRLEIIPYHNFSERPSFTPTMDDGLSDVSSRISMITPLPGGNMSGLSQWSIPSLNGTSMLTHPETMTVSLTADPIGFGMSLEGGESYPIKIASIEPDGPAGMSGQLRVGDRILAINEDHLEGASLLQAVKLVQEAGDCMTMEVECDVSDAVNPTVGTFDVKLVKTGCLNLGISIGGDKPLWIADIKKGGVAHRFGSLQPGDALLAVDNQSLENAAPIDAVNLLKNSGRVVILTIRKESLNSMIPPQPTQAGKSDAVIFSVVLDRKGSNLGISLKGSDQPGQPIIISSIKPGGVADKTGTLREGYRILAINGESLFEKTLNDAVRLLKTSGDQVTLKISKGIFRKSRTRPRPGKYHRPHARTPFGKGQKVFRRNGMHQMSNSHLTRVPSRMSQMSESGLSTSDFHSTTSLDQSMQSLAHVGKFESTRRNGRLSSLSATANGVLVSGDETGLSGVIGPPGGRLSPSGKHRHSPTGRGRNNLSKERGSPNRGSASGIVRTNGQPSSEGGALTRINRFSLTETTDEETTPLDDEFGVQYSGQRYGTTVRNQSSLGYHDNHHSDHNEWTSTFPRIATHRKSSLGNGTKRPAEPYLKQQENIQTSDHGAPSANMEEAILKQLEATIVKSKDFVEKLNELAQSGSSDQDSDSEPAKKAREIPPQMHEQLRQHVKQIMTPARLEFFDINLMKSNGTDLGFSVSDGLVEPGVYVKSLKPGSAAYESGQLQPFDRIMKVNDIVVKDMDCCAVLPILKECGDELTLTVARNPLASGQLNTLNGPTTDNTLSLTQSS